MFHYGKEKLFYWQLRLAIELVTVQFSSTFSGHSQCAQQTADLEWNRLMSSTRRPQGRNCTCKSMAQESWGIPTFLLLVPPFPWSASCKQGKWYESSFFPVQQHGRVSLPRTRASMNMFIMTSAEFPNTIKRTLPAPTASICVCVCVYTYKPHLYEWMP